MVVVVIVDCAVAFDAVTTIPPSLSTAGAINAIAMLPLTTATQLTTMTPKAVVDKHITLVSDGG